LTKLAKFHAASLVIHQKHPNAFDSFDMGMFSRRIDAFNGAFISIFEIVVEEISTWKSYKKYAKKMEKMKENFIENATKCFDIVDGDFCVLNHGDVWTNNLMFKYEENGKLKDANLVSFSFVSFNEKIANFSLILI
jgi:thiamine kinase-like enzyme